ncbi:hypothetical protein [Microbulbifer pacificus]|uniref:hypothetical protein n=1 Tax=Microbulbifer pacificus TaxID=407164 RepID=UPI001319BB60|nr:hypothetical protein [Microbulbifer pacificus]
MAQLRQLLIEANHGVSVTVTENVFSDSSRLALETGRLANGQSPHLRGRDPGKPRIFRLVKNRRGCWLVRDEDGERWLLDKLNCIPEIID